MAGYTLSACLAEIKAHPGQFYVYVLSRPDGTPFYVGCGKVRSCGRQRIAFHEAETRSGVRSHKCNAIRLIQASGLAVCYSIDSWHKSEPAMFDREVEMIRQLGRADFGRGPLANWSDGGDGIVNRTEAMNAKARASMLKSVTPEFRATNSRRTKAHWDSPEGRKKRLEVNAAPETRARKSAASFLMNADPKARARKSATMRGTWQSPEYQIKQCAAHRAAVARPEYKAKMGAKALARWSDPQYRERLRQAHRQRWARRKAAETK